MTQALLSGYRYSVRSNTELWNEPKANTVKNPELTRIHTARPTQSYLKSLLFWLIVIPASALHGKVFISHEIKFKREAN